MPRFSKMFCGMFIFGAITASNMSAREAHAKRYPGVPCFNTFFANAYVLCLYVFDLRGVGAGGFGHG